MLLSDVDVANALVSGDIVIDPYDPSLLQPCSVDVRLADSFKVFRRPSGIIDPQNLPPGLFVDGEIEDGVFTLHPGKFVLASTLERIYVGPSHAAVVEGKSSLGRIGIQIHSTAGFIDPGFDGQVTLELSNLGSEAILLTPGMPIAQVCFYTMLTPASRPYGHPDWGSHYQNQAGATPPASLDAHPSVD